MMRHQRFLSFQIAGFVAMFGNLGAWDTSRAADPPSRAARSRTVFRTAIFLTAKRADSPEGWTMVSARAALAAGSPWSRKTVGRCCWPPAEAIRIAWATWPRRGGLRWARTYLFRGVVPLFGGGQPPGEPAVQGDRACWPQRHLHLSAPPIKGGRVGEEKISLARPRAGRTWKSASISASGPKAGRGFGEVSLTESRS